MEAVPGFVIFPNHFAYSLPLLLLVAGFYAILAIDADNSLCSITALPAA